ncbi:23S rRNA (guanine745-N1)-methyltransferase [Allocatelliglobosispora scoriae]|uniref:23S rRNA (Guanine745-N1)-methyltransferase n=1 Tax=Allocatelliglobosispora scoriae TaxID=643052 RepID=A0A841BMW8_9ACTN|nr:methyltransferase domain-containing protein [Allocatelliglobosispora scoriae]MBB5870417.1 23S rRNA (guanine745-N1)-methyltransferase [Allocatelliglobosispora scoriae]
MNDLTLAALRCPVCASPLTAAVGALRCAAHGHSFDIARQGYAHLGAGKRLPDGDSAAMVAARIAFLDSGHYAPLATTLAEATPRRSELIVDTGGGTGYYLAAALDRAIGAFGLVLDVSKPALRRAARCHPRASAALADTWGPLPLADGAVDVLLNVFAPRNGPEFARVLAPGGRLIVVTPEAEHLAELRRELGLIEVDPGKEERLAASLRDFELDSERTVTWPLHLTRAEVESLVAMGPTARHLTPETLHGRVTTLPEQTEVTATVRLSTYRPH